MFFLSKNLIIQFSLVDRINVANKNRQLGSAAPGGNRGTVTRESNYGVHLSPNERRQNEEINKLGAALFDKSEIGVKDRWMNKRK